MTRGKILKKFFSEWGKVRLKSVFIIKRQNQCGFGEMNIKGEWWILSKKSLEHKKYDSCKSYNPEWRMSVCSIYPYQKQRETEVKEKEVHDTG